MITCLECGFEINEGTFGCPHCSKKYTISKPIITVFYPDSNPAKKNGNGLECFHTVTAPKVKKQRW